MRRWSITVLLFGVFIASGLPAMTQPVDPYRVAVFTPGSPPFYFDPRLDQNDLQTPGLSYPRFVEEIEDVLSADVRFALVRHVELTPADGVDGEDGRSRSLGNVLRDRGIESFGRYELGSAIDDLRQALANYSDAGAYLTHPSDVAVAYEYLARANIEQANRVPEQAVARRTEARDHFREMIRLSAVSDIQEGLFPSDVVDLYHEAYLELLVGDGLGLGQARATGLAERHGLDRVVWSYFIKDLSPQGELVVSMRIEVYDPRGERVWSEAIALDLTTEGSVPLVNRAMSRFLACVPLRYEPPPPERPGDAGRFFLQAGWGAGVYAERPVDGQFLNQGVGVTLDYHLTDNFGLFGRANVMFGGRDPQGDLLGGFTSTRLSGGIALSVRADWFRPFLGFGLELNIVGGFTASDNFWCKVSGGEIRSFGGGRACTAADLQEQDATVLLGPYLMPGFSIDIVGPFGAYLLGSFAFYISDARTNVDFPLVGEAGIEYRF